MINTFTAEVSPSYNFTCQYSSERIGRLTYALMLYSFGFSFFLFS